MMILVRMGKGEKRPGCTVAAADIDRRRRMMVVGNPALQTRGSHQAHHHAALPGRPTNRPGRAAMRTLLLGV